MIPLRKQREQRRKKIVALYKRGFSCAEIGALMTPKVTRQRVYAVLKAEGVI